MPWWLAEAPAKRETAPVAVQVATAPPQVAAQLSEEIPVTESRLSGLRNLLFGRAPEAHAEPVQAPPPQWEAPPPPPAEIQPPFNEPPAPPAWAELQSFAEPFLEPAYSEPLSEVAVPCPEPVAAALNVPAPSAEELREVTAVPEFLPPKLKRQAIWEAEAAARRERRDTVDDLAVLPSWRGQYRRKDK